jgi:hypothetical protein
MRYLLVWYVSGEPLMASGRFVWVLSQACRGQGSEEIKETTSSVCSRPCWICEGTRYMTKSDITPLAATLYKYHVYRPMQQDCRRTAVVVAGCRTSRPASGGPAHVRVWVTVMPSSLLLLFLRGLGLGRVACRRCYPPCRRLPRLPVSSEIAAHIITLRYIPPALLKGA